MSYGVQLILLFIGAVLVNNFVLMRYLGLCPYLGVSKQFDSAFGMGMAVIFVLFLAAVVTWPIYYFILVPLDLAWMRTIFFILVIAGLVQTVEIILQKSVPSLYRALGIFLPLITTNCAVLGVTVLNIDSGFDFLQSAVHAIGAGVGFTLALLLMAGLRERMEVGNVPKPMRGLPIAFITAGLMSVAFLGFSGLIPE
ncbi:MAG: electron transport complex subunit RsxA [Candidatus Coatesbacteria bacterium RBG_13_66_14]|uniref:Ion-translocating oxidoreductase complex subunit A n=1 Tax=Candidatus Coatesbacteria bacterium RBG_13_66_14 TaxID=1817816 RepID=A0A1F5F3H8_9BACT|nr:MAG: electron transport complex subunit RsxA [Candidatus Coatesbacteria bacterium RBG_13_66_14]